MSANNSKPKSQPAPVIVLQEEPSSFGRYMLLMVPSLIGSVGVHLVLFGIFFLIMLPAVFANREKDEEIKEVNNVTADQPEEQKATFSTVDVDPAATEFDTDINYMVDRIGEVSVPGSVNPNEAA